MELELDNSAEQLEWKPRIGMEFDSEPMAYEFYNQYSKRLGFSIRIHYRNKSKKLDSLGCITTSCYVCSSKEFPEKKKVKASLKNPRGHTRMECLAKMGVQFNEETRKYEISNFVEEHNHGFTPRGTSYMLRSQRCISEFQGNELVIAEESGLSIRDSYSLMSTKAGGKESIGFTKLDQKNYLCGKRMSKLAYGEAGSLMQYLKEQTVKNPSFYHAIQLDNEEQITNIFWADARMIIDYSLFGDVVSFDTTYKINKEHRPFTVFVGFNHHRQVVVFGAALMYDETIESFEWLFQTFLEAMSNRPPQTIITDQDAAMAAVIPKVMPTTFHRLCEWHIMQNTMKHVSKIAVETDPNMSTKPIKDKLAYFMDHIDEEADFLAAWEKMLDDFDVRGNHWLDTLYKVKEKWAHTYVRLHWCAGMKSTQLSESFNASLKNYLQSDYNLMQFLMHFERLLSNKRHKELEAEFALSQKQPKIKVHYKVLVQAGKIYTRDIFEAFQAEFFKSVPLQIRHVVDDGENTIHMVCDDEGRGVGHVKRCKSNDKLSCSCRLFEMCGILCKHALKVFREVLLGVELPAQYILKRWTRDARSIDVKDVGGRNVEADGKLEESERYAIMMTGWRKLADRASKYKDAYRCVLESQADLQAKLETIIHANMNVEVQETVEAQETVESHGIGDQVVNDENSMNTYTLKKRKDPFKGKGKHRKGSGMEINMDKAKAKEKAKVKSNTKSTSNATSKARRIEQDANAYISLPPEQTQQSQIDGSSLNPPLDLMLFTPPNSIQALLTRNIDAIDASTWTWAFEHCQGSNNLSSSQS